jgi:hypothetical protein
MGIKGSIHFSRNNMANDMETITKNKKIIWIISSFNRLESLIVKMNKLRFLRIEQKEFLILPPFVTKPRDRCNLLKAKPGIHLIKNI